MSLSGCSLVLHPGWLLQSCSPQLQRDSVIMYSIRCKRWCCAQTTMDPGQYGIILDTSKAEPTSQGRPKPPTSSSTGSVPCISEARAATTWYKTLELSLPKSSWTEQGLDGPGLLCAQMNILVLCSAEKHVHGTLHLSQEARPDHSSFLYPGSGSTQPRQSRHA